MQISKAIDAGKLAEARLPELLLIHDLGKTLDLERYGVKGLPSGLRRRTRSHNSYRHFKRPRAAPDDINVDQPKMMNRKMRRREQFRTCQGNPFDASAPASTSELAKVFLPTHVFQAKRMTMRELFGGYVLPEGLPGKGHGTRSFMFKLSEGCILHDMSYWCSIEFDLGDGGEAAVDDRVQGLVEQCAASRRPLMRSPTWVNGDLPVISLNSTSRATLWAHCAYAGEAVAAIRKLHEAADVRVGRLGRIELRGPRSRQVLEDAVASMKGSCPAYKAFDAEGAEERRGCTVVAERATYASLFKAICLTGRVLLCGQREWHWYNTMQGLQFYPDDYERGIVDSVSSREGEQSDVPVRVWVRNKGVLEAGMELVDNSGHSVGFITSAKPRMIPNKYSSIGMACHRLFETEAGGRVKRRLAARPRGSSGSIEVTVRLL